jgi:hypothetical protein
LARAYTRFENALALSECSPIVSAGPSAAMLLAEVACTADRPLQRVAMLRTRNLIAAVLSEEIDIGLTHASSLDRELAGRDWPAGLVRQVLLTWRPVRAFATLAPRGRRTLNLDWEAASLGGRLNRLYAEKRAAAASGRWPCDSFEMAVALLRRGAVRSIVIPEIYLNPADAALRREPIAGAQEDALVAVFREADAGRWRWLLDADTWLELAQRLPLRQ